MYFQIRDIYIIISDILKHNTVELFFQNIHKVIFFKQQYRSHEKFSNFRMDPPFSTCMYVILCNIISISMPKIVYNRIGGTFTLLVAHTSIQKTDGSISTPLSMFNWTKNDIQNIHFTYEYVE